MLRGLMKLRLIRFALWSLQSRDEGADKEGAKRWREKWEKARMEWDMRQDKKMGASGGRVKHGEAWDERNTARVYSKKRQKEGDRFAWKKVAGHTRTKGTNTSRTHEDVHARAYITLAHLGRRIWNRREVWEAESRPSVRVPTKAATFCWERILLLSIQKLSDE